MIRINLLAADRPTKKKRAAAAAAPGSVQAYLFLGLFTTGAVALCALGYLWQSAQLRKLDAEITQAQQRQRELQAIKKQVDDLEAKRATFQRKVDLIERLKAEQSAPVHMLDEISKALPDFVWLTSMESTGPPGTASVKLQGQSSGLTPVADFISALQRSGWFPSVDLVSSTETNNIVTFALQASFKSPEVAAKEAEAAARKPLPGSTAAGAKPGASPAPPAGK
jgi:type IV pilus assembly protein PilN